MHSQRSPWLVHAYSVGAMFGAVLGMPGPVSGRVFAVLGAAAVLAATT